MPAPKEFLEGKSLLCTLNKAEAEEVFEILLRFSYEANEWVAPTFDEIAEALNKKLKAINANAEAGQRNSIKKCEYERRKKWAWFYKLIGKELIEPEYEEVSDIFSIMAVNPDAPAIGLRYMRNMGYVEFQDEGKTHYAILTQKALDTLK